MYRFVSVNRQNNEARADGTGSVIMWKTRHSLHICEYTDMFYSVYTVRWAWCSTSRGTVCSSWEWLVLPFSPRLGEEATAFTEISDQSPALNIFIKFVRISQTLLLSWLRHC